MKFFEVCYPYYALVKAKDKEEAMKIYTEAVADDDETLKDEMIEVDRDYALVKFSRGKSEDKKPIPISKVLKDFKSDESMVLLIDGALL